MQVTLKHAWSKITSPFFKAQKESKILKLLKFCALIIRASLILPKSSPSYPNKLFICNTESTRYIKRNLCICYLGDCKVNAVFIFTLNLRYQNNAYVLE